MDFNLVNAKKCLQHFNGTPERVLVIGAGRNARDVEALDRILSHNSLIIGVDISPAVGEGYQSPNVIYVQADATDLPFVPNTFDLCYSFATLEHIHDVASTWQNMLRVIKPGGLVYTVASPLWCHPYGHHKKNIFQKHPWVHLMYPTVDELVSFAQKKLIQPGDNSNIVHHIEYMLNPAYFNKHRPSYYSDAASGLSDIAHVKSWFSSVDLNSIQMPPYYNSILEKGYSVEDLSSATHYFLAQKR